MTGTLLKCTYDNTPLELRKPARTKRAGIDVLRLVCPKCREKFLATDTPYSHPYQTHPTRLGKDDVKKVYSVRLSARDRRNLEKGICHLTIYDNRLQLQYKT